MFRFVGVDSWLFGEPSSYVIVVMSIVTAYYSYSVKGPDVKLWCRCGYVLFVKVAFNIDEWILDRFCLDDGIPKTMDQH